MVPGIYRVGEVCPRDASGGALSPRFGWDLGNVRLVTGPGSLGQGPISVEPSVHVTYEVH